jgi:hypothetical protein
VVESLAESAAVAKSYERHRKDTALCTENLSSSVVMVKSAKKGV